MDVFENDVAQPAVFADIMRASDIRMIEPSRRAGLGLKPPLALDVACLAHRENLHRDRAMQIRIPSAKHGPHPAAADKLLEQHMIKLLALERLPKLPRIERRGRRPDLGRRQGGDDRQITLVGRSRTRRRSMIRPRRHTGSRLGCGLAVSHGNLPCKMEMHRRGAGSACWPLLHFTQRNGAGDRRANPCASPPHRRIRCISLRWRQASCGRNRRSRSWP